MPHYSNRPSYVQASYLNQRLFPYVDPSEAQTTLPAEPNVPPPSYDPNRRSRGPATVISARSTTSTIVWRSHPSEFEWNWKRIIRIPLYFKVNDREEFSDSFPVEFGQKRILAVEGSSENVELNRTMSGEAVGTEGAGINLTHTRSGSNVSFLAHPLEPIFAARIHQLNTVISNHLLPTRRILIFLEIIDIFYLITLIIALIVTKGKQDGFLTGVSVTCIIIILLNAGLFSQVRVKRWSLQKELRSLARDFSPLPLTSSTNAGLLSNFLGGGAEPRELEREKASLRWSLRNYEGSYWTSYRPICKVELVTPARVRSAHIPSPTLDSNHSIHRVTVPTLETNHASEADAPAYEA